MKPTKARCDKEDTWVIGQSAPNSSRNVHYQKS